MLRRRTQSSYSSNYETYRYITSSSAWSPDGKYLAFAGKRDGKDDIVIVDVRRNKEVKRIKVPLSGANTPTWSPDGQRIVFSGLDGGPRAGYRFRAADLGQLPGRLLRSRHRQSGHARVDGHRAQRKPAMVG